MVSNDKDLPTLSADGMAQLDPETCGSSVRWFVRAKQTKWNSKSGPIFGREFEATVHLTDCGRQITWSCGNHSGGAKTMLKKLDRALTELRNMRRAVKAVSKFHDTLEVTKRDGISGVDD
jgi:hypothetical protein